MTLDKQKTKQEVTKDEWEDEIAQKIVQAKAKFFGMFNKGEALQVHPLADSFPYMNDEEIKALSDSIRADGLRNPIIIDIEGNLVDGRNRMMALLQLECTIEEGYMAHTPSGNYPLVNMKATMGEELSVVDVIRPEYRYRNKYEEQIKRFILSENMDRRHLTTSQKAALGALVSDDKTALSKKDVAERFAIGSTILREAIKIKDADADVFDLVLKSDLTVSEAIKALKSKADEERKEREEAELPDPSPTDGMKDEPEQPDQNPESGPEEDSEPEVDSKPKQEEPQMSVEERTAQLRYERDVFALEEAYMMAVIALLQQNGEAINAATKQKYKGTKLTDKEIEEIRFRTEQAVLKKMFDVKDSCTFDKNKIDKVIADTLHQDAA